MSEKQPSLWSSQDYEEACEWFVEFRTSAPDSDRREAFHAWLQQSPAHISAYLDATAVWNETAAVVPHGKYSIDTLIAAAAEKRDNVRTLERARMSPTSQPLRRPPRSLYVAAAVSSLLLVLGLFGIYLWGPSQIYSTDIGEQRSVLLQDGSIIQLNSRSRVSVLYTDHDRQIQLLEGQALFSVEHDTKRPFLVSVGDTAVRAVGTQFDVNRLETETVVTVLEGKVTIEPSWSIETRQPKAPVRANTGPVEHGTSALSEVTRSLAAGEQLRVVRSGGVRATRPDVAAATAWIQRRLVFEATPLADVVEEFNRYNNRPLRIISPKLRSLQIDGVFSSTDPQPMIRFLQTRPGIRVTESDTSIVIAEK